jgi:hypothetical protein
MTITHEAGGVTRLEGLLIDQAVLYGLLNKRRDLALTLVTLQRVEAAESDAALFEEPRPSGG